jgi:hypothetical protein
MEMIWSQPTFTFCAEPLNIRRPMVRKHLGVETWKDAYSARSERRMHAYFASFAQGRNVFLGPAPFRTHHRFRTRRTVFKIIHGAEDRVDWLCDEFNGRAVLLLRHPIAVSLSRQVYPRLHSFLRSDYRRHFTAEQQAAAWGVLREGSVLERGVLSWALQNAPLLRSAGAQWPVVTYEQLVLDPDPLLALLADRLALPAPARMCDHLTTASTTTSQSSDATQRYLKKDRGRHRNWLVEKWREQVTHEEEQNAMAILDIFEIDAYASGEMLPSESLWKGNRPVLDA